MKLTKTLFTLLTAVTFLPRAYYAEYHGPVTYDTHWRQNQSMIVAGFGIAGGEFGYMGNYKMLMGCINGTMSYAAGTSQLTMGIKLPSLAYRGFSSLTAGPKWWGNYRYLTGRRTDSNIPDAYAGIGWTVVLENFVVINTSSKPNLAHLKLFFGNQPVYNGMGSDKSTYDYNGTTGYNYGAEVGFGGAMGPGFSFIEINLRYQVFAYTIPSQGVSDYFGEIGLMVVARLD